MKIFFTFFSLLFFSATYNSQSNIISFEELVKLEDKEDLPNDVIDILSRKGFKFANKSLYALVDLNNGGGKKFVENCYKYSYVKDGVTSQLSHCTDKLEYYSKARFTLGFNSKSPKFYDYIINIVKKKGAYIEKKEHSNIPTPTTIYVYKANENINVEVYKYFKDGDFLYVVKFIYL